MAHPFVRKKGSSQSSSALTDTTDPASRPRSETTDTREYLLWDKPMKEEHHKQGQSFFLLQRHPLCRICMPDAMPGQNCKARHAPILKTSALLPGKACPFSQAKQLSRAL